MAFTLGMDKILMDLRPGEAWKIVGDPLNYGNLTWLDGVTSVPTEQQMLDAELAAAKSDRIDRIKTEAQERILAAVPQWKQNNLARGAYDAGTTTSLNTSIDTIRTDSDTAEAAVNALTTVQAVIDFTW